jgi:pimeloyl-ACP methyl ester carboxylesterase/DNA-binding CsgD family transcriptional regulator
MNVFATATETSYVRSDGLSIAYQVLGDGPPDIVFIPSFVSNLELAWEWPPLEAFYKALAAFSRLILFDKRGTGLSDRVKHIPDTVERMRDLGAVMDAVGAEQAAVVGLSEGAPLAVAYAVAHPERVSHLILYGPLVCATRKADYPWGEPAAWWEETIARYEHVWGNPEYMRADVAWRAPSEEENDDFVRWWAQYRRLGASPGAAADMARMNSRIDVRHLLPRIEAPTTVIVRAGDRVIVAGHGRYVAGHIPGAEYVELPGEDHLPFTGDSSAVVAEIAKAVGVSPRLPAPAPHVRVEPAFPDAAADLLSPRELEVMRWVARGKTNRQIAIALYVTEATVRKHLEHVYEKLGVPSRTAALARLNGAVAPELD